MANRMTKEKAEAIADAYITNGYKQTEALLSCGYKPAYAKQRGKLIMDNILVQMAIRALQAKTAIVTGLTIARIQAEHLRLQAICELNGDYGVATSNLIAAGRTVGAYAADNAGNTGLTLVFNAEQPARCVDNVCATTQQDEPQCNNYANGQFGIGRA